MNVETVAEETDAAFVVAPQTVNLRLVAENSSYPWSPSPSMRSNSDAF